MKLKIALTSDTHKGVSDKTDRIHREFFSKLALEKIDALFWAGDLIANKQEQLESTLKLARAYLPETTIIVCRGNHDLWDFNQFKSRKSDRLDYCQPRSYFPPYKRPRLYRETIQKHKELFGKYNIIHLDGTSYELSGNIIAIGFDGWYSETDLDILKTNDSLYLPNFIEGLPSHEFLRNKAEKDLEKILNIPTEGKIVIGLTHFPPFSKEKPIKDPFVEERLNANGKFLDVLTDKCDYLLVGHSHQSCDIIYNDCRILNSGSDYDKPRYVIFEIES